jgi:hypothetical protein
MRPIRASSQPQESSPPEHRYRFDWLRASVTSGFIATFAMTVTAAIAYGIANAWGDANGNSLERNLHALTANPLTENVGDALFIGLIVNVVMGIVWAAIYARLFEPYVEGPTWQKGIMFALIPWILSILVFFPLAGVGMLGSDIDAGGLPVLGNLILHLVYGVTLAYMYAVEEKSVEFTNEDVQANANAERGAAVGIFVGALIGGVGGWLVSPTLTDLAGQAVITFVGGMVGASFGMLLGSFYGVHIEGEAR